MSQFNKGEWGIVSFIASAKGGGEVTAVRWCGFVLVVVLVLFGQSGAGTWYLFVLSHVAWVSGCSKVMCQFARFTSLLISVVANSPKKPAADSWRHRLH